MSEDQIRLAAGIILLLLMAVVLIVPRRMGTSQEALRFSDVTAGALFAIAMATLLPIPTLLLVLSMIAIAVLWILAGLCIGGIF